MLPSRAAPRRSFALVLLLLAIGVWLATAPTAGAAPAQDPGTPVDDTTVTTTEDLLQGDPAATITTTVATSTTVAGATDQENEQSQAEADEDTRRVWTIVAALVGVAFLLTVLTLAYARRTKPRPLPAVEPKHRRSPDPSARR